MRIGVTKEPVQEDKGLIKFDTVEIHYDKRGKITFKSDTATQHFNFWFLPK